jgi:hypothetical protein
MIALCLITQASIASAQTDLVVDPTTLEFTPSPDHASILRYEFEVLPATGSGAPVTVLNLGRPTPTADGQIRVDLTPWHLEQTLGAGTYRARVSATSDGGTSPSTASNPFTFSVGCSYTLGSSSASVAAAGGTATVAVTTSAACAWTATSPVTWITVAGARTGSGTATLTVQANTTTASRTATLTIAGRSFTVTQGAGSGSVTPPPTSNCKIDLSAGSESIKASGANDWSVRVTTTTGCAWTAVPSVPWITVNTPSGTGSGPVVYDVEPNTSAARSAYITIGPWQFVLNQAAGSGGTAPACTYGISTSSQSVSAAGGGNSVGVTGGSACSWSASSPVSWISLGATSGTGNATLNYTVAANTATSGRSATLTIAGKSLVVNQAGAAASTPACTYSISPATRTVAAAGGANSVAVTAGSGCSWSATESASWLTLGTSSGSGNGTATYTVAANTSTSSRTVTLTIAGQAHTVTQSGAAATAPAPAPTNCKYDLSAGSESIKGSGANNWQVWLTTTSECAWTAVSSVPWITVHTASGTGKATINFSVAANTGSARNGYITIGGWQFVIKQSAGR